jgi:hypothetical protein
MAKARKFRELEAKMSSESQERVSIRVRETLKNMELDERHVEQADPGASTGPMDRSAVRCSLKRQN